MAMITDDRLRRRAGMVKIRPVVRAVTLVTLEDIDWEFPTSSDTQNFSLLPQEFRIQLNALSARTGKRYLLTFDGPAGSQNYVNINLAQAASLVDFITIDGYNYAGSWDTQTNDASSLYDSPKDPEYGQELDINDTVEAYLNAGVPPSKYTMGVPLYGAGWTGVPNINRGLYQSSTGPSPVPLADGTGLCTDLSGNTPGCDTLLTPGLATYYSLENLEANGYAPTYDPVRVAVTLYNASLGTFYTFDSPLTAALKAGYVNSKGLGGGYVWALKDDDANGTMVKTLAQALNQ